MGSNYFWKLALLAVGVVCSFWLGRLSRDDDATVSRKDAGVEQKALPQTAITPSNAGTAAAYQPAPTPPLASGIPANPQLPAGSNPPMPMGHVPPNGSAAITKEREGLSHLAAINPEEAVSKYLSQVASNPEVKRELGSTFQSMAAKNPRKAVEMLDRLPDDRDRGRAAAALARTWSSSEPEAAWQWASSYPFDSTGNTEDPRSVILSQMMASDPGGAAALASRIAIPELRENSLFNVMVFWMDKSPREALTFAASLEEGEVQNRIFLRGLQEKKLTAPETFKFVTENIRASGLYKDALSGTFLQWGEEDPAAAVAAYSRLPAGDTKDSAAGSLLTGWIQKDPDGAEKWAQTFPERSIIRVNAMAMLQSVPRNRDAASEARRIESLPAADFKPAVHGFVNDWARKDPAAAAKWVSGIAGESDRNFATVSLVESWAMSDGRAAAKWVASLDEQSLDSAMLALLRVWGPRDIEGVAAWVHELPVSATRDKGAEYIAARLGGTDPEAGVAWARSISKPESRNMALVAVYRSWKKLDPAAANAWLEKSEMPDNAKKSLLAEPAY